jgi:succinate dehydrogenase/fumarate reductase flavoprotein subunit
MRIECDYLVIGSGLAGLTYSLKVADSGGSVVLITKKEDLQRTPSPHTCKTH